MIYAYNPQAIGDVLMVMLIDSKQAVNVERKADVARIYTEDSNQTVGYNFFNIKASLTDLTGNGQLKITDEQMVILNSLLIGAGFNDLLENDSAPKLVVGYVKECIPHPNSDHLSITQTEVDGGQVLQIVCGAPNIAAGQKVIVAKPGTMMPDGLIIWPGELRGEKSNGMICSAKELGLPNASMQKGILVLDDSVEIGQPFSSDLV